MSTLLTSSFTCVFCSVPLQTWSVESIELREIKYGMIKYLISR